MASVNRPDFSMEKYKTSRATRFFFLGSATIIGTGIWLTGVSVVHWLLYLPVVMFAFAAATGICPGMIVSDH
jgi:ABC-type polysaccharide/polyol phosphate export permease